MKRIIIFCLIFSLLLACVPTPEEEYVVMKDTEHMIDLVHEKNPEGGENLQPDDTIDNTLIKTDRHYTYSYESPNGLLHITADADVYMPKTGKLPMARVKEGVFTDAFAKAVFDKVFQGKTVYENYYNRERPSTKAELAEMIAAYQEMVDAGRIETEKDMSEQEALEFIEKLKEKYKTAPDKVEMPELIVSDGSMQYCERTDYGFESWYELRAANEGVGSLMIRRPAEETGGFEYWLSYQRGDLEDSIGYTEGGDGREMDFRGRGSYTEHTANAADTDCAFGQTVSPADAVKLCVDFLKDLGVTDVLPRSSIDVFTLDSGEYFCYLIDFVRTVNGTQIAFLPSFQGYDRGDVALPWQYEHLRFFVDGDGINSISWDYPVEVTKIESGDAAVLTYEQAIETFESMGRILYEGKTEACQVPCYIDVEASRIELDLVRIREKDAPGRYGLYVPAWVFYGKTAQNYNEPVPDGALDDRLEIMLLIVNAVDGSIIDLEKGY